MFMFPEHNHNRFRCAMMAYPPLLHRWECLLSVPGRLFVICRITFRPQPKLHRFPSGIYRYFYGCRKILDIFKLFLVMAAAAFYRWVVGQEQAPCSCINIVYDRNAVGRASFVQSVWGLMGRFKKISINIFYVLE